jgi:hypothetical protein
MSPMTATVTTINGATATPAELRRVGLDALERALGTVGMIRFLQQADPGSGDYTADRHRFLGNPTVSEIMTAMRRLHVAR